jgi:hypothetical protein
MRAVVCDRDTHEPEITMFANDPKPLPRPILVTRRSS